ncbi:PepSY domain-containing protein [Terribacillus sp. DMT04]|uniref:PepSY domain-containing protein n=1 Tax=Terribacillus sp. DMT04 TaxID=2850441 RepID=UPI001C2C7E37|nr:PepSY domain-containing protein [Terribacillus sp. DMT04]QXE02031.1 PepSY domain-containing protein [Terribacillus sp. DMT04]
MKKKNLAASGLAVVLAAGLGFGYHHVSADDNVPTDTKVNLNQAIDNASKEQAGTVTSVELESRNGNAYYEVDVNDDKNEYDLHVNADDGTVDSRKDDDDDDDDNNQAPQPKVDLKTAAETALAQEKGAALTEISLDEDDGKLEYDVELRNGKEEIEVTVDAETGEVTYTERETDDGDDD